MSEPEIESAIRAAVAVITEPILRSMQEDPHQWSERPCATCRSISAMVGKPFGCYLYAEHRAARRAATPKETP